MPRVGPSFPAGGDGVREKRVLRACPLAGGVWRRPHRTSLASSHPSMRRRPHHGGEGQFKIGTARGYVETGVVIVDWFRRGHVKYGVVDVERRERGGAHRTYAIGHYIQGRRARLAAGSARLVAVPELDGFAAHERIARHLQVFVMIPGIPKVCIQAAIAIESLLKRGPIAFLGGRARATAMCKDDHGNRVTCFSPHP